VSSAAVSMSPAGRPAAEGGGDELLFFNPGQAATVDSLVSQIIPSEDGSPGAHEARVTRYIDRGLAGFMRDLQGTYRSGLLALQELAAGVCPTGFADADEDTQREVVTRLSTLAVEEPGDFVGQFFRIVREHTIQGFFGDPAYGGNEGLVGWRLVGFPGAQFGYTTEQMRPGVDARAIPMLTIRDLYARLGDTQ